MVILISLNKVTSHRSVTTGLCVVVSRLIHAYNKMIFFVYRAIGMPPTALLAGLLIIISFAMTHFVVEVQETGVNQYFGYLYAN